MEQNDFEGSLPANSGGLFGGHAGTEILASSSTQFTLSIPEYLSYVFGALYLGLWSLSFYPQLWENYKRRNTYGLALEYVIL